MKNREGEYVEKPWGSYKVILETPDRVVKIIRVAPGGRLSLQSHKLRSEWWMPISGRAMVSKGYTPEDDSIVSHKFVDKNSQFVYIDKQQVHRLYNPENEEFVMMEIQEGECREDDIIRYDDVYGRCK